MIWVLFRAAVLTSGLGSFSFASVLSSSGKQASAQSMPLVFEENRGQLQDKSVLFIARFQDGVVLLQRHQIRVVRQNVSFDLQVLGGNLTGTVISGERPMRGRTLYLSKVAPSITQPGVRNFRAVRYQRVYPGIDLLVYAKGGELEYDWEVAAGADPTQIRFSFPSAGLKILASGALEVRRGSASLRHSPPLLYQPGIAHRHDVDGGFLLHLDGTVGFRIGSYDRSRPLVVDPYLIYGATFGGRPNEGFVAGTRGAGGCRANGIAVDKQGYAYVTGSITDPNGLPNLSAIQPKLGGAEDAFVAKLNQDGTDFEYAVVLGGPGFDESRAIAIDASGNAYVTGTSSGGFPVKGALSSLRGGIFVAKINAEGTELVYSFVFGGAYQPYPGDDGYLYSSAGNAIAVTADGSAFVAGTTSGNPLPTTPNAFQRDPRPAACIAALPACTDAFVGKVRPNGDAFDYLTYLSGSSTDLVGGIVVDELGQVTAAGTTLSSDFPVTPGAFQSARKSNPEELMPDRYLLAADGFVTRLSRDGRRLIVSTYFGGSTNDLLRGIVRDRSGSLYVVGTGSVAADFPFPAGARPPDGEVLGPTMFVAKLDESLSVVHYLYRANVVRQPGIAYALAVNSRGEALVGAAVGLVLNTRQELQEREIQSPRSCYLNRYELCEVQYVFLLAANGQEMTFASEMGMMSDGGGRSRISAVAFDDQDRAYVAGSGLLPHLLPTRLMTGTATTAKIGFDGDGPRFQGAGVVNAASFETGIPPPGALVTIFGTGLTTTQGITVASELPVGPQLGGTSVVHSGRYLPILAVSGGDGLQQVNAQIHWDNIFRSPAVGIIRDGRLGYAVRVTTSPTAGRMGIFMVDAAQPAIVHATDFNLITASSPARAGESIVIFGTGLGLGLLAGNPPPTGYPAPFEPLLTYTLAPEVVFGNIAAKPTFVGVAPGFVGLDQINVIVPVGLPSGLTSVRVTSSPPMGTQTVRIHVK
ncbi:MAG: hypothetical protein CBB60_001925 [Armatimonadetes bacterium Cent15-Ar3]|nr:MAG: hypothetical protein CBB60_001925 [Armatimonadetes bacterium Cent15-Ar3]